VDERTQVDAGFGGPAFLVVLTAGQLFAEKADGVVEPLDSRLGCDHSRIN
jgi:hypothetical protein